jgi:hypothetical protein
MVSFFNVSLGCGFFMLILLLENPWRLREDLAAVE